MSDLSRDYFLRYNGKCHKYTNSDNYWQCTRLQHFGDRLLVDIDSNRIRYVPITTSLSRYTEIHNNITYIGFYEVLCTVDCFM